MSKKPQQLDAVEDERVRVAREVSDHRRDLPDRSVLQDEPAVRALLAALVESSDDAIVAKDLNGTILSWNRGAERIFGYTADEVIGLPILVLIPEERRHEEDTILATMRRGDRIDHFETQRVRKDGRTIDVSVSISPIRDGSGTIIGIAKIARDVTATRAAHTLQATLAAIVESSDDAIIGKTLDGIIMTWNAGAVRLFGYRADDIVGRSILTLLPTARHPEEATILATLRQGRRIEHFETERRHRDGHLIPVSLSVSPIRGADGTIVGAAKIVRDISVRRSIEREREALLARERAARSEAEAANRSKDAFLATVSHELRTPLSPIIAWARMLRDGGLPPEKTAKAIATIERSARTQAQLIDDLLDVSRIIAGKMRLEMGPTDLVSAAQAALEVVRPAADAKDIRLEPLFDPEAGTVLGDPDRLQQVIWNLLSNAVKFTPRGGRVEIAVSPVDDQARVRVTDTGEGFAPAFHPYIFDRFRQADGSATRRHGGLGLGLAIVRHIVELHGGSVAAESPGEGRGATFTVDLPRGARTDTGGSVTPPAPARGLRLAGRRVLIVDDQPDSNEVVSAVLGTHGAEVRVADGVTPALQLLESWVPDVVITDIGMPERDGYRLLEAVRASSTLARVPVVALTAFATHEDRQRVLAAGFRRHLAKPVDVDELVTSVVEVLTTPSGR